MAAGTRLLENPALIAFEALTQRGRPGDHVRSDFIRRFGFAIPTDEAIETFRVYAPHGAVELGAGIGYWAYVARQLGVDVLAFDIAPPPSPDNLWFAGVTPWHPIAPGNERSIADWADRALLLVWPTRDEMWPADALASYRQAGGQRVIYVGEPPGGRTGDDVFHARLGQLHGCAQCSLGAPLSPCVCQVVAEWRLVKKVPLPHWPGCADDLYVFEPGLPARPRRLRTRARFWTDSRAVSETDPSCLRSRFVPHPCAQGSERSHVQDRHDGSLHGSRRGLFARFVAPGRRATTAPLERTARPRRERSSHVRVRSRDTSHPRQRPRLERQRRPSSHLLRRVAIMIGWLPPLSFARVLASPALPRRSPLSRWRPGRGRTTDHGASRVSAPRLELYTSSLLGRPVRTDL